MCGEGGGGEGGRGGSQVLGVMQGEGVRTRLVRGGVCGVGASEMMDITSSHLPE